MRRNRVLLGVGFILLSGLARSTTMTPSQTQSQLHHLNEKIGHLKQKLDGFHHQQSGVEQALSKIDKKMDSLVQQSHAIAQEIAQKQIEIRRGSTQIQHLSAQLRLHQIELMKQVRTIYLLGIAQPLKGVLMASAPDAVDHWLVFYQYVLRARQRLMDNILETKEALAQSQEVLEREVSAEAKLKAQLNQEQEKLHQVKAQQKQVIAQLSQTIKTDQQTLQDYERDKVNLSGLLQHLLVRSQIQMHDVKVGPADKRIPSPIQGNYTAIKPWNQGLVFFSKEGTSVHAVQAGRVVFSDWLRGYGLLLILDHGGGWMSLYGYNQSLYRHTGEWVKAGEQIATVGHSGGRPEDGLYFEVRRLGHVVAAQRWLMARQG